MYKVISFTRVSSQQQNLESQNKEVHDAIIRHGYSEDEILYVQQKESAIKLSMEERVSLQQMFNLIKQYNTIEYVFVYEISRLSRQPKMLYELRDFFIEHKVNLKSLKPELTLLDNDFRLSQTASIMFSIFASLSESEMMLKKERMARGREYKRAQGLYAGSPIAIGYKQDKDKIVIDEPNAALVRRIFTDYISGKSVRTLAKELQNEGWRKNTKFLTLCQSILNILHREYYCGDKLHPAIITKEQFEQARQVAQSKTIYRTSRNNALLKGLMYDKESGYLMSSNMSNGQYYSRRYGHCTISMKAADTLVSGVAREWYEQIYVVKADEYRQMIESEIERNKRIISTMTDNITNNQDKIDRIEERYIDGKISKEKADELERKAFEELNYYKSNLENAKVQVDILQQKLQNYNLRTDDIYDIVHDVINRIYCRRLSKYVCEVTIINKYTGEQRIYEYNTRKMQIVHFEVVTRPALHLL